MENQELQSKNITIARIEQTQWGYKVFDEFDSVYNVSFSKKDGTPTKAYLFLSDLPNNGLGLLKNFSFVVAQNKQGGQSKYVRIISEPQNAPIAPQTAPMPVNAPVSPPQPNIAPNIVPAPQTVPTSSTAPLMPVVDKTAKEIRANTALKMVSELVASGKIEMKDWELWSNRFNYFQPNEQIINSVDPREEATPSLGTDNHPQAEQESVPDSDTLQIENIPF